MISESKFDYLYDRVIDYYRDIESMYILDVHCGNSSQKHIKFILCPQKIDITCKKIPI